MARATNPGAPQRVSAHVVPKAPSFSTDDEEEKTTIESGGWEEEASTTVEQGEVADKVRALALGAPQPARSNTAITSTDGSGVTDEPTVDDQRASAALALLPPPTTARLMITQGNDSGRLLEVRPGKTYTIGRGIDNDLVLTDITASRKHFDIRNENGSWILADRGSGNGTLINNRIEDAPFMLASGDTIEVGNTAFRFDVFAPAIALPGLPREVAVPGSRDAPAVGRDGRADHAAGAEDPSDSREMATPDVHAPPVSRELVTPAVLREAAAEAARGAAREATREANEERALANGIPSELPSFDGSVDDDLELSTVSGKPMPDADAPRPHVTASRPKTLPPPAPLPRPRTQTGRPPLVFASTRSQQIAVAQPAQAPLPPGALAAAMAPTISPMHAVPALPQPATTLPLPQMANRPPLAPGLLEPPTSSLPATIPGQGPPVLPNRAPRLPFSYPGAPDLPPQRPSGMLRAPVNVAPGHPGRDATSTALVQPMTYSGGQGAAAPQPIHRVAPLVSRRMMIALGLLGLAVFAAIATIAIMRSAVGPAAPAAPRGSAPGPAVPPSKDPAATPRSGPPTVTPIQSSSSPPGGAAPGARTSGDRAALAPGTPPAAPVRVAQAGATAASPPPASGPALGSPGTGDPGAGEPGGAGAQRADRQGRAAGRPCADRGRFTCDRGGLAGRVPGEPIRDDRAGARGAGAQRADRQGGAGGRGGLAGRAVDRAQPRRVARSRRSTRPARADPRQDRAAAQARRAEAERPPGRGRGGAPAPDRQAARRAQPAGRPRRGHRPVSQQELQRRRAGDQLVAVGVQQR